MGRTTDEIRGIKQRKEEKLGRELSKREVRKIEKKVVRKNAIRGVLVALGLISGTAGATNLLNAGKNEGIKATEKVISVDLDEADKDLNITSQTDREVFINNIKVDENTLNQNNELEDNVTNEIEALQTPEDVIGYVKEIYVEEYNDKNQTNIEAEQVSLRRTRVGENLYLDKAENGDQIIRRSYSRDDDVNYMDIETGFITAEIGDIGKEIMFNKSGEYKTVYEESQQVDAYEDNVLASVGEVIDTGISLKAALEENEKVPREYKERLIDAVVDYKNDKIQEIVNGKEEKEEENEIGY